MPAERNSRFSGDRRYLVDMDEAAGLEVLKSVETKLQVVCVAPRPQANLAALELNATLIRSSSDWLMFTRCKSHDGKIKRSPVTGGITMA